jgi:rhamnogalacturonan endolyase
MEDLDRGVVAVRGNNGNYVGWRMMGYEYRRNDPSSVSYNLYRDGTLVANVTDSTNCWDAGAGASAAYSVSAVIDGAECEQSEATTPWSDNYIRIPLSSPGAYESIDATPGDLDGDGQYEIILKWQPSNAKDNSQSGVTDNTYLEALELDGTSLWRIDLGRNIRSGAHYTQMSVYDFDGDGRAELAVKTAPGTRDGTGAYLSMGPAASDDDGADYRNGDGYILSGPEYLTVFDGQTGAELATVDYPVPRGNVGSWGDDYGNRLDRYNSGVAMVTDQGASASGRPSIIRQRGYYTRLTMSALNWRDGQLTTAWIFDSNNSGNGAAAGQGDHSAMAADMDGDLAQEINTGALTIGSDGTLRCTTGRGHGDAQHVGELVVGQGISVFTVYEGAGGYGVYNGNTCQPYVEVLGGDDNGRGVAEDIYPGNPGAEFWSATSSGLMSCANGSNVGSEPGSQNFLIYWDADETRELQDGASITKYGGGTLLNASGCSGNNGTKNTPSLTADLLGDWREELVVRESNNSALRVYTTTDVTSRRIYTLMHDPTYRMQVTFEQSSYNQPPHTGFHIGDGMADPPEPDIHVR